MPTRSRRTAIRAVGVSVVALGLMVTAGCTRDGGSDAESADAAAGGAVPTAAVSGAAVELESKKIGILNINGSDPGAIVLEVAAEKAVETLNWTSVDVDAAGNPSKAAAGMSQLLDQKVDAILLIAVDPAIIGSGLKAAEAANIPVVIYGGGGTPSDLVTSVVPNDYTLAAYAADYLVNALNGEGKVAIMSTDGIPFSASRTELLKLELAQYPGIEIVATHQVDYANYQSDLLSATRSVLQANPDLDAIYATVSPYPTPIAAALKQAGATEQVKLISFYAYASSLKLLKSGQMAAVADASQVQNAYAAVDLLVQQFGKDVEISANSQYELPLQYQLITAANLPEGDAVTYPIDSESYYEEKWAKEFTNVS